MLLDDLFRPAAGLAAFSLSDFMLYYDSHFSFDRIGRFH